MQEWKSGCFILATFNRHTAGDRQSRPITVTKMMKKTTNLRKRKTNYNINGIDAWMNKNAAA